MFYWIENNKELPKRRGFYFGININCNLESTKIYFKGSNWYKDEKSDYPLFVTHWMQTEKYPKISDFSEHAEWYLRMLAKSIFEDILRSGYNTSNNYASDFYEESKEIAIRKCEIEYEDIALECMIDEIEKEFKSRI